MANDNAPADPDARRELERKAFARPHNEEEQAESDAARLQLAALQESAVPEVLEGRPTNTPAAGQLSVSGRTPVLPVPEALEGFEGPPPGTFPEEFEDEPAHAPQRSRSLIPLLVIVGLVVGVGGGVAIARFTPSLSPATSANIPTPKPTRAPGPLPDATTAIAALSAPQYPTDIFPDDSFATSLGIEKDSTHRILTTSDGLTLWIGKSPQAICMLYTGGFEPTGGTSGATCASIFEFGDTGLTLSYGHDLWTWDGTSFTTTVEH